MNFNLSEMRCLKVRLKDIIWKTYIQLSRLGKGKKVYKIHLIF